MTLAGLLIVCVLLGLILREAKAINRSLRDIGDTPAVAVPAPVEVPAARPHVHHAGCIEVLEFDDEGNSHVVSEHHGGMSNAMHHAEIGAALRSSRHGVRWEAGHIERGSE